MATETLFCEVGQHKWKRKATRGRKPKVCPQHKTQPPELTETELVEREEREAERRRKAGQNLARGREKARQRERETHQKELRKQLQEARTAKTKVDRDYRSALTKALAKEAFDEGLWNRSDSLMATSMQLAATIRNIEQKIGGK